MGIAGLRFGELAALDRADVDILRRRLHVSKSVAEISGHLILGETKNRKTRTVAIPATLAHIINDHLIAHNAGPAFPDSRGGILRLSNYRKVLLKAAERSGVKPFRIHDLRHTAAALMLAADRDLFLTMRQLGHSSIAVTVDRYGHLLPGRTDRAADKLDRLLNEELTGGGSTISIARPR